jgi:hypothetical protein
LYLWRRSGESLASEVLLRVEASARKLDRTRGCPVMPKWKKKNRGRSEPSRFVYVKIQ